MRPRRTERERDRDREAQRQRLGYTARYERALLPTVALTEADVAWAAGFLEGEGSFRLAKSKTGSSHEVTCPQKDPEPVQRLLAIYGGRLHQRSTGMWVWTAHGERALSVMEGIYPLMSARRKVQIDAACTGGIMRILYEEQYK